MKVLIVSASDINGGAARAAYRLHKSLIVKDVDSQMLVQSKDTNSSHVLVSETKINRYLSRLRPLIDSLPTRIYKNRLPTLFSPSLLPFSDVVKRVNTIKPDVVHLHWITGGMMRVEDIAKIKVPIIWSLHDMWGFTGGCHYSDGCSRYEISCGKCKVLGSEIENDLSANLHRRKSKIYSKLTNLTVVGLSRWMESEANKSSLFKDTPVVNLPNPIDTEVFSPYDKYVARDLFNLPQDKKLVLFGAIGATSDPRKGFKQLSEALEYIDAEIIELVIFGSDSSEMETFNHKVHYLGRLHDDIALRLLYCTADVMVVPSLQEAFGQTASEAMSCGVPVVAFRATGLLDIVDHMNNGYLAEPYSAEDLAKGINFILNAFNYEELSRSARGKVLRDFDSNVVAGRYISLYKQVINSRLA